MVKLGIICEDETGKVLLESAPFREKLKEFGLHLVSVQETGSVNQFFQGRYEKHRVLMLEKGVEKIVAFFDLDRHECVVKLKEESDPFKLGDTCVVACREVESWYLADDSSLSSFLAREVDIEDPENEEEPIKKIIELNGGKGFGKSKPFLAMQMLRNGFTFTRAANHPKAKSAQYFIQKLKSLAN